MRLPTKMLVWVAALVAGSASAEPLSFCEVVGGGALCRTQANEVLIEQDGVYVDRAGRFRMDVPRPADSAAARQVRHAQARAAIQRQLRREAAPGEPPREFAILPSGQVCVEVHGGCMTPEGLFMPAIMGGFATPSGVAIKAK